MTTEAKQEKEFEYIEEFQSGRLYKDNKGSLWIELERKDCSRVCISIDGKVKRQFPRAKTNQDKFLRNAQVYISDNALASVIAHMVFNLRD
jgi:hypothetical protein